MRKIILLITALATFTVQAQVTNGGHVITEFNGGVLSVQGTAFAGSNIVFGVLENSTNESYSPFPGYQIGASADIRLLAVDPNPNLPKIEFRLTPSFMYMREIEKWKRIDTWNTLSVSHFVHDTRFNCNKLLFSMTLGICPDYSRPRRKVYYGGLFYGSCPSIIWDIHEEQHYLNGEVHEYDHSIDLVEDGQIPSTTDWGCIVGLREEFTSCHLVLDLAYQISFGYKKHDLTKQNVLMLSVGYQF